MLVPKKQRKQIYNHLFKEGVMVAKKDFNARRHHELDVPNLYVIKLMQSLKSRGYVKENFNWGWFYWFLTNEGIEYLRNYLHLPEEIVPDTLKKPRAQPRPSVAAAARPAAPAAAPSAEKKVGAPSGDFKPDFRGYGRGAARGAPQGREGYRRDAPRQ